MMTECSIEKISDFIKTLEPSEDERNHVFWLPAVHAAWGRSAYLIDVVRELSGDPNDERSLVLLPRADKEERTRRDFIRSYGPSRDGRSRPLFNHVLLLRPMHSPCRSNSSFNQSVGLFA
ncbi:hypothetical protein AJ87_48805 [Rhizobium yanglingense]|nr:hypothetical protein AJ87_48805 [Rhizobium yanglingense]